MKKLFIIANWKSNKTILEAGEWLQTLNDLQLTINKEEKRVIVCPPFTLLPFVKQSIVKGQLLIAVGAQNISPFDEGAYTGEISGKQVKEFADYVIIGHSERRKYFGENDQIINQKIEMATKYNLIPIICISDPAQINNLKIEKGAIIAYEPLFAIGSGNADTPENASLVGEKIKKISGGIDVLYGGSVTSQNVNSFTSEANINGVLVGGASLDAQEFSSIIKNA